MDLRKISVIGAILLFVFAAYPIISGDVSLFKFWKLIVVSCIGSGTVLLVWGLKPDLEKSRLKIEPVVKPHSTYSGEEIKIASIVVKNVVYLGKKEAQNCRIELKIKDLWKRFRKPSGEPVNIKAHHTYTFPICQVSKEKDYAEIVTGLIDLGVDHPFPNKLKKNQIYEILVKLYSANQEEKMYRFKVNTSWDDFGLKLDC